MLRNLFYNQTLYSVYNIVLESLQHLRQSPEIVSPIESTIKQEMDLMKKYHSQKCCPGKNGDYLDCTNRIGAGIPYNPIGGSTRQSSRRNYDRKGSKNRVFREKRPEKRYKGALKLVAKQRRGRRIPLGEIPFKRYSSLFR